MVTIQNFAAAFIGNSRYGWFNEGQTEGPSTHLQREFTDALYHDKLFRIGAAHLESKIETVPWVTAPGQWEEGALRWCFYCNNVLGDPAMGIWTNEPISIQADYQSSVLPGTSSIDVSVTSEGNPVEGLTCVILRDSIICGVGNTDASGNTTITLDPPLTEIGNAELIISGYNCLPSSFPLIITSIDDDGNNLLIPYETKLYNNYPNPFNPATTIKYSIHSQSYVNLTLLNSLGETIKVLVDELQSAGTYEFSFNGRDLSSGIYFCRIQADNYTNTIKMILLK